MVRASCAAAAPRSCIPSAESDGARSCPVLTPSCRFGWECTIAVASGLCPRDGDACPAVESIPICTQVFVLQFIIAFGIPLAMCIRVGNLLGSDEPMQARFCAKVAWGMALATQAVLASTILLSRARIAALFTDDEEVLAHTMLLMPITTSYSVISTLSCGWSQQLLFGLGAKLRVPALVNFLAFFGVGIPVGAVLAFHAGLGVRGVWAGLLLAVSMILTGQYSFLLATTDWHAAAKIAREKAANKESAAATTGDAESEMRGLAGADSAKDQAAAAMPLPSSTRS